MARYGLILALVAAAMSIGTALRADLTTGPDGKRITSFEKKLRERLAEEPPAWAAPLMKIKPHYNDDFEGKDHKPIAAHWGLGEVYIKTTPSEKNATRFLGEFHNDQPHLTLKDLPQHKWVHLQFDLYVIRTWDGMITKDVTGTPAGPDHFILRVDKGPYLWSTTFSNNERNPDSNTQSYPGLFPVDVAPARTGARVTNSLGYTFNYSRWGKQPSDSVYRMHAVFPHTGKDLRFIFEARNLLTEPKTDESWGIDNVQVRLLKDMPLPEQTDKQRETLWAMLADDNAARSTFAMWALVAGGDKSAAFLKQKLKELSKPSVDEQKLAALIRQLDHETYMKRESATNELIKLGPVIRQRLEDELRKKVSAETRARIGQVLEAFKGKGDNENILSAPGQRRHIKAKFALQILEGPPALPVAQEQTKKSSDEQQELPNQPDIRTRTDIRLHIRQ